MSKMWRRAGSDTIQLTAIPQSTSKKNDKYQKMACGIRRVCGMSVRAVRVKGQGVGGVVMGWAGYVGAQSAVDELVYGDMWPLAKSIPQNQQSFADLLVLTLFKYARNNTRKA